MAYAAVISLQKTIQNLLDSPRISLLPHSPQVIKHAYQRLKSLKEILQRLDESSKSSSRKNVNVLDTRIKEAVWKFEDLVESHVYNQILVPHESEILEVNLEEIRDAVDSFTKTLKEKEKEKEYMYELHHLLPEEEEEEEDCYKLQHVQFEPHLSFPFEIEVVDCSPSTVTFANEIRSTHDFLFILHGMMGSSNDSPCSRLIYSSFFLYMLIKVFLGLIVTPSVP